MQRVLVVDASGEPLMPCQPARARQLLKAGKARVVRHAPFTIKLTARVGGAVQPVEIRLDPGSKTTGLGLVALFARGWVLVWAAEVVHRGEAVKQGLDRRRGVRHKRRARHTRYRPARFRNRRRKAGWLAPSLWSRVNNVVTWTKRLRRWCPVVSIALERVKFDTQLLQDPEISGVEYQQGTLHGYEIREYLLEKWERRCAYCGKTTLPLEVEHLIPRSRPGTSDRVSNLTLACHKCNQTKGTQTAAEFGYPELMAQAQRPLKDAAAVNSTRKALHQRLQAVGLPVSTSTGGRTKYNRTQQGYPKTHWIDAACVGERGINVEIDPDHLPLRIIATGRQAHQMCLMNKFGFPRTRAKTARFHKGFQTGDLVYAVVPADAGLTIQGRFRGRISARANGSFSLEGTEGVKARYCRLLQRADGYLYQKGEKAHSSPA